MPSTNTRTSVADPPPARGPDVLGQIPQAISDVRTRSDRPPMSREMVPSAQLPVQFAPPQADSQSMSTAADQISATRSKPRHQQPLSQPPTCVAMASPRVEALRRKNVPALRDLTIIVPQGNITVLLGPNGAGKTTAIRMITGAMTRRRGHGDGVRCRSRRRRRIGAAALRRGRGQAGALRPALGLRQHRCTRPSSTASGRKCRCSHPSKRRPDSGSNTPSTNRSVVIRPA